MEKRLDDLRQRLQSSTSNVWCQSLTNEINRLSSVLSSRQPIYHSSLTRIQLLTSIKTIQDVNINAASNELYRRALTNYLLLVAIHTDKFVCEFLLGHLHELRRHLNYWKHDEQRQQTQLAIIDQIKTTFWFDQVRDDIRTSEKIKYLQRQEDLLMNIIGRLAYNINHLEQQGEKISLDVLMKSTNDLSHIFFEQASVNYNPQSDLIDVLELYYQILTSFDDLKVRWIDTIQSYSRPTHFKRYLSYYVCFTALGIYTCYRVYSNRDRIATYVYSSYDSLKFFIHEHLIVPLKTIYTSTFESRSSQVALENSQMNYAHSKKILEEMLEQYGRQHATTLAQVNQISVDEFLATLNERARNEDMNIVMKNYQQELNSPIRSALLGDLIKGILIQVQKVKVDGEDLVIQIDQLMKQNQINFSLLATIPTVLLFTFFVMTTRNLLANHVLKRRTLDLVSLRQQIIRKFRQIEHVLIFNSEQPALMMTDRELVPVDSADRGNGDAQQAALPMTLGTFGHFLSLIYELTLYTDQLKSKRMLSEEFNDDIHLLTYSQLSIQQKLLLIEQIFHSYSFLVHT